MPIKLPVIDDRTYDQIVTDALARVRVHTPEWTHTGAADPGVTLVELFGFMAETLLYRANLIPDRNRLKFLQLLGQPLRPASPATGLVCLLNDNGEGRNFTLPKGLTFFAGALPFRSEDGLDVPPVEGYVCIKRKAPEPAPELLDYYRQLYEATGRDLLAESDADLTLELYDTVALDEMPGGYDAGADSVDGALWVALLAPVTARPEQYARLREQLAGRTLSLGLSPIPAEGVGRLVPGALPSQGLELTVQTLAAGGGSVASYVRLDAPPASEFPERAGVLQVTLPRDATQIVNPPEAEPLEAGVGELPPMLGDEKLAARVLTWLRVDGLGTSGVRLGWAGIHCVRVTQRYQVSGERLAPGTGESDQGRRLAQRQVLAETLDLRLDSEAWRLTDELAAAPREDQDGAKVFSLDAEDGLVRFGNGQHGARPALGVNIVASYEWSAGSLGNVAADAINRCNELPSGFKLRNPIPTQGGTAAESVEDAERRIPLVLRHRDRAVSAGDFKEILSAAPGADVGRVEVLAAWHPELSPALPGDQPGVVTVLVIPRADARDPDNPLPDGQFIQALCNHLAPRRLVTCEVLLRAPIYVPLWISVGIDTVAGESVAVVRERVASALRDYLSPLPAAVRGKPSPGPGLDQGWPLFRSVSALELAAVVARVAGVAGVFGLLLSDGSQAERDSVAISGLQLPYIAALLVGSGDPAPLGELIGGNAGGSGASRPGGSGRRRIRRLPIPRVPSQC